MLSWATFVDDYNHTHRHIGIGLNTPADVHDGPAAAKPVQRSAILAAARAQTPERFSTSTDPKILALPEATWINKPSEKAENDDDLQLAA